jgi:glucose-6-phosphate 1-dehydrogenase
MEAMHHETKLHYRSCFLITMSFDLVLFGGTGDLAWRKLMPALFQAFRHGTLPAVAASSAWRAMTWTTTVPRTDPAAL